MSEDISTGMRVRIRFEVMGLPLHHNLVVDQSRDDVTHLVRSRYEVRTAFFIPSAIQSGFTLLLADNLLFQRF
jgi:hypothetical protein